MQETELFKMRFLSLTEYEQIKFLENNKLNYSRLTMSEFKKNKFNIMNVFKAIYDYDKANAVANGKYISFYKIPFEDVSDLIASRHVFLYKGYACVPTHYIIFIITNHFKNSLSAVNLQFCIKFKMIVF